jgi:ABC-2 type transport system permease protein
MMISDNYSLKPITALNEGIPENINTMLIVSPKEKLSSWDLYQIDQYIMKGNSVGFFIDTHTETMEDNQNPYNPQPPIYVPRDTGLEKLLNNYGVNISKSYVLDENCYEQTGQNASGGLSKTTFYFAPEILSENINKEVPFLKNIKGLILLNASPLIIDREADQTKDIKVLFSSSNKSWEMKDDINLYNPTVIFPPAKEDRNQYPLAALIEGNLDSYFSDKEIPQKELKETKGLKSVINSDLISNNNNFIPNTSSGRVFVIGTSAVLTDNILDKTGTSPNAVFIYNVLDKLNGRDDFAEMRSKGQPFNPLKETTPGQRSFIKGFLVFGLPLIVIFSGLIAWLLWTSRKNKIELLFRRNEKL